MHNIAPKVVYLKSETANFHFEMMSEQSKRFKYWQMRTIIATMVGYALFYFVRKNFSLAMPASRPTSVFRRRASVSSSL